MAPDKHYEEKFSGIHSETDFVMLSESGEVTMQREGREISDAQEAFKVLANELKQNLARIARLALLVS